MASLVLTGDTSGQVTISAPAVAGTTTLTLPATTGTVLNDATVGVCRAWVNFNGTGTVAIRASFNVTSITDNGTGDYTVNFTTAMTDANYAIVCGSSPDYAPANSYGTYINTVGSSLAESAPTTSSARISYRRSDAVSYDPKYSNIAIFR